MSELLNALNPHIVNGRARTRPQNRTDSSRSHPSQSHEPGEVPHTSPQSSPQLAPPLPKKNVPYSSELELAMVVPQPVPPSQPPQR